VFSGHSDSVLCGGFSPDGKVVATGSYDGSLRLWAGPGAHIHRRPHPWFMVPDSRTPILDPVRETPNPRPQILNPKF